MDEENLQGRRLYLKGIDRSFGGVVCVQGPVLQRFGMMAGRARIAVAWRSKGLAAPGSDRGASFETAPELDFGLFRLGSTRLP